MKKIRAHIMFVLVLLVTTASIFLLFSQKAPLKTVTVTNTSVTHKISTTLPHHQITKLTKGNDVLNSVEPNLENYDFISDHTFLKMVSKVLVFAFLLSFLNTKFKKRRFFYDAFIRLFSSKYIILRTLRI